MLVEPRALPRRRAASELDLSPPRGATVLIGPEGGWTPDEVARGASRGVASITLGGRDAARRCDVQSSRSRRYLRCGKEF